MLAACRAIVDVPAPFRSRRGLSAATAAAAWAVLVSGGCGGTAEPAPGEPVYEAAEAWARAAAAAATGSSTAAAQELAAALGPIVPGEDDPRAGARAAGHAPQAAPWRPGEWITVRGVARSSGFDLRREFFVLLDAGLPLVGVECFIDARDLGAVRAVPPGEPLTLRGRIRDGDANLVLEACRLR